MRQRLIGLLLVLVTTPAISRGLPLHLIKLPAGFKIELYSSNVPNARSMNMSPAGTLFVGSRHAGKVYAIRDTNRDGRGDKVYVIAQGLNTPNGVAFHKGALYVAEINRILRFDDIESRVLNPPQPVVVSTDFPTEQHHGGKFIRIGPDEKLYVPIGAPCNVCIEYGYAVITRLNLDGSEHEIYAEGVRNTVGFDWHPGTRELWFTDNGRDQLGDDLPPDELNRAADEGLHFGFPYCHGGEVLDPEFGLGHGCNEYVAPVQKLGAHVASLGMRFYIGNMFPPRYQKQIFIAEHGSWNRSEKSGYRVSLVTLSGNQAVSYEPFAEGWLQGQQAWGRPVDIEHMVDGSLLVSDDKAGAIYRIYYDGSQPVLSPAIDSGRGQVEHTPAPKPALPAVMQKPVLENRDKPQQTPSMTSDDLESKPESTNKPVIKPARQSFTQPPPDIHEKVLSEKQQKTARPDDKTNTGSEPSVENKPLKADGQSPVPPPELIEKIRARTEQDNNQSVDPFSPVKKQTVNE